MKTRTSNYVDVEKLVVEGEQSKEQDGRNYGVGWNDDDDDGSGAEEEKEKKKLLLSNIRKGCERKMWSIERREEGKGIKRRKAEEKGNQTKPNG